MARLIRDLTFIEGQVIFLTVIFSPVIWSRAMQDFKGTLVGLARTPFTERSAYEHAGRSDNSWFVVACLQEATMHANRLK